MFVKTSYLAEIIIFGLFQKALYPEQKSTVSCSPVPHKESKTVDQKG